MLDHVILEQIRHREEARRQRAPELTLELPRPMPAAPSEDEPEERERGVVVLDIL